MSEPDHIVQQSDLLTPDQRAAFIGETCDRLAKGGLTHFRISLHPSIDGLVLIEGWRLKPHNEGEPRWQLPFKLGKKLK